jgi:hypothetical protein
VPDLITVKQLPVIEEQLKIIKDEVKKRAEYALSLECTEETIKEVKKVRADLNKDFADLESRRKAVKTEILKPYEAFEQVYKDCVTDLFKSTDAKLKEKISDVENNLKAEKEEAVKEYFEEYKLSLGLTFIDFSQANINITLSASLKSLKNQVAEFLESVKKDMALIQAQEYADEILVEYKRTLDANAAILTVIERHRAIEEAREFSEYIAKTKELEKTIAEVDEILAPPKEEEPTLKATFTVYGTKEQLKALREFMMQEGIRYE